MSLTNNRLSVTLAATAVSAVKTAVTTINTQLPFLVGLTPEERKAVPKIDVGNKIFVEDALLAIQNNATLFPAYLNVAEVQKDFTLYEQLDELVLLVGLLYEKLRDTQILAGSEAYTSALIAYKLLGAASDAGLPGADAAYNQLKQRFSGQGGNNNEGSTTTTKS